MSAAPALAETDALFVEAARAWVVGDVANQVRQLTANPARHRMILTKLGLDMLAPAVVIARASAMLEQELERRTRRTFEFGRALDLRAIIALAQKEMADAEHC